MVFFMIKKVTNIIFTRCFFVHSLLSFMIIHSKLDDFCSVIIFFSFNLLFFFNSYVYLSYKRKKTKTNIYPPEKVRIFLLQKDVILTSVRCMFFESTSSRLFCSRGRFFFSSFSPRKCRVDEKNTCKHEGLQTYLSFMDVACRRR